jgi:hypothetical protein
VKGNRTLLAVGWKDGKDLAGLSGKAARFRFHLSRGRLYSFWVGAAPSGASRGYVAAGGPAYDGPVDR